MYVRDIVKFFNSCSLGVCSTMLFFLTSSDRITYTVQYGIDIDTCHSKRWRERESIFCNIVRRAEDVGSKNQSCEPAC